MTHPLLISRAYPKLCCTLESRKRAEVGARLLVLFIAESSSKLTVFLELCKSADSVSGALQKRERGEREQLEQRRRRKKSVAFFFHSFLSSLVLCKIMAGCTERGRARHHRCPPATLARCSRSGRVHSPGTPPCPLFCQATLYVTYVS